MDIDWIRDGLKRPGKTQRGLAKAMGIDASAVNRLLAGNRQLKASEIEKAQAYLQDLPPPSAPKGIIEPLSNDRHIDTLMVLGMAEGGHDGWNLWNGEIIEHIRRPDNLIGVPGAYAVYVTGNSMEPRYNAGELAHIHPGKPVTPGAYVLVQKKPKTDGEVPLAVIKRLVRRSGSKIVLCQLSPAKEIELKPDEVLSMHRVVGSSEA